MKTSDSQRFAQTEKSGKVAYEAPACFILELELESPVLTASSESFEDGGSYDREFFMVNK